MKTTFFFFCHYKCIEHVSTLFQYIQSLIVCGPSVFHLLPVRAPPVWLLDTVLWFLATALFWTTVCLRIILYCNCPRTAISLGTLVPVSEKQHLETTIWELRVESMPIETVQSLNLGFFFAVVFNNTLYKLTLQAYTHLSRANVRYKFVGFLLKCDDKNVFLFLH